MSDRKQAIRQHLETTRSALMSTLSAVGAADWDRPVASSDGAWTVKQALAHLVSAESGQLGTGQRMLAGEAKLGEGFSLDIWNQRQVAKRKDQTPESLLDEISASRQKLLAWIDGLAESDLDQSGQHGAGDVITVEHLCYRIGKHEATHAVEIKRALDSG
jgi:hypothetical protein